MELLGSLVIAFFKEHEKNDEILKKGIYINSKARQFIYCSEAQGMVKIRGKHRPIEFSGYGDGVYRAHVKL